DMKLRDEMPELEGATAWYNSDPIKKEDLVGNRPTFIHFWSVSCGRCKNAMPKVNEFRDEYKDQLNVIAVHMPRSKQDLDLDQIQRIAEEHDITQPILVDHEHKLNDGYENENMLDCELVDSDDKL